MHGGADPGVEPRHSLRLAEKLQEQGASYELEVYAGGDHNLSGHRAARDAHAIEWFGRYLDAPRAP
jgi:dipeptidyl aminopeptidase/acylaminoacyl peptidase